MCPQAKPRTHRAPRHTRCDSLLAFSHAVPLPNTRAAAERATKPVLTPARHACAQASVSPSRTAGADRGRAGSRTPLPGRGHRRDGRARPDGHRHPGGTAHPEPPQSASSLILIPVASPRHGDAGMDALACPSNGGDLSRLRVDGVIMSVNNSLYGRCSSLAPRSRKPVADALRVGRKARVLGLSGRAARTRPPRRPPCSTAANGYSTARRRGSPAHAHAAIVIATTDKSLKHKGLSAFLVPTDAPASRSVRRQTSSASAMPSPPPHPHPHPRPHLTLTLLTLAGQEGQARYPRARQATSSWRVRCPRGNMLGRPGDGFKLAMATLDGGRIGIAAQALGIARRRSSVAIHYAQVGSQSPSPHPPLLLLLLLLLRFLRWLRDVEHYADCTQRANSPASRSPVPPSSPSPPSSPLPRLHRTQDVQRASRSTSRSDQLADMATRVESARLLTHRAAALKATASRTPRAAMAKLAASEAAFNSPPSRCLAV